MSNEQPPHTEIENEKAASDQAATPPPPEAPPSPEASPEPSQAPQAEGSINEITISHRRRASKLEALLCWPEVLAMFENGAKASDIAHFIQDEKREYLHASYDSLLKLLYYWLRKNQKRHDIAARSPTAHVAMMGTADRIDPIDALNMIFAIQMDRIIEHWQSEKEHKNFTNFNTSALRLATDMVRNLAEIEHKRRPLQSSSESKGITENINQILRIGEAYTAKFGKKVSDVLMDEQSRRRVLNAIERAHKTGSESFNIILAANEVQAAKLRHEEELQTKLDSEEEQQVDSDGKVKT